jgi:hypothetical protein
VVRPQTDEARGGTGRKRHTDRVSPSAQRNTETFLWTKKIPSITIFLLRGTSSGEKTKEMITTTCTPAAEQRRHSKNSRVPSIVLCRAYIIVNYL